MLGLFPNNSTKFCEHNGFSFLKSINLHSKLFDHLTLTAKSLKGAWRLLVVSIFSISAQAVVVSKEWPSVQD